MKRLDSGSRFSPGQVSFCRNDAQGFHILVGELNLTAVGSTLQEEERRPRHMAKSTRPLFSCPSRLLSRFSSFTPFLFSSVTKAPEKCYTIKVKETAGKNISEWSLAMEMKVA